MTRSKKEKPDAGILKMFSMLVWPVFRASPVGFVLYSVLSLSQGALLSLELVAQTNVFDRAAIAFSNMEYISTIIGSVVFLGIVIIINQIISAVVNVVPDIFLDKIDGRLSYDIHIKMSRISSIHFENESSLNDINKAEHGKSRAVMFVFTFWMIFTFYIPYFIFVGWFLFTLKPALVLSIVFIFVPTAFAQFIRSKVLAGLEDKSVSIRRQTDYYEYCMAGKSCTKETRQSGAFHYFEKQFLGSLEILQGLTKKAHRKVSLIELGLKLFSAAGYLGILYLISYYLFAGDISIGSFAAIFYAIGKLYNIMEEIVCGHFAQMANTYGTIQNYLNFMNIPDEVLNGHLDEPSDIKLQNVAFKYPDSETFAVNNVSLTLEKNKVLAIVGENGSGKSTLAKLISDMYTPLEGKIIGRDCTTDSISAIFQDYQKYQLILQENITISQFSKPVDQNELESLYRSSGVDYSNQAQYPDGNDTMLSREFDGIELSGGQWQRIAIARGLFKDSSVIILDEPTSAVDPLEETKLYEHFQNIAKGKTTILITHRLGSVKIADKIAVMKNGTVVEQGTHHQLMKENGVYHHMFREQAKWYDEDYVFEKAGID